jgi:hypothetical protein
MEEHAYEGQVAIRLESADLTVAPGSSVNVPVTLHNLSATDGSFEISVRGIPGTWVSVPAPVMRLAAGEQRQVLLTIQPPSPPAGRAGRHHVALRATRQEAPGVAAEVSLTLTVAALQVPGRIGLLLAATEFAVAPDESVTIPIILFNQGLEGDVVTLSVEGIPLGWITASSASTPLSPGQHQEVTLTIQPPRSGESGAGRHPFKILAASQAVPGQVAVAECILTIAIFSEFSGELRPQQVEAGQPARVMVENLGNIQQAFTLTWQSPDDGLEFSPAPSQEFHVAPGEMTTAEFSAKPRSRPLFGRERTWPFTTRVQAAGGSTRNLNGEVLGKPIIPGSVLTAILVAVLVIAAIVVLVAVLGGSPEEGAPPVADATATPVEEAPAPTEAPPEPTEPPQEPTEAPPEPTQPPEPTEAPPEPTEPPQEPTEAPPEPTQPPEPTEPPQEPPSEPPGEGESPCAPIAGILVIGPLLVIGTKGRRERNQQK